MKPVGMIIDFSALKAAPRGQRFFECCNCPPEVMRSRLENLLEVYGFDTDAMLPLNTVALVRQYSGDLVVGELVMLMGALTTLDELFMSRVAVAKSMSQVYLEPCHAVGAKAPGWELYQGSDK